MRKLYSQDHLDILLKLCFRNLSISMDIHGYPPKNGLDMDMDMDAIFHLHGKPGTVLHDTI